MRFKFWGVRGSIPTPSPYTVKYGGNTTCIEVRTSSNDLLILDAGTGIYTLAQTLPVDKPLTVHILITHTHWDHIQGLPFFLPIFAAHNRIHIYGGQDSVTGRGIDRAMNVQLQHSYFPISVAELKADIHYHTLNAKQTVTIGSVKITPIELNHPVRNLGYRIDDSDGSSLFFSGDYEPLSDQYGASEPEYGEVKDFIEEKQREILQVIDKVDALIIDSSYTDAEYPRKRGWGHGTYQSSLSLAERSQARKLFFTHHEPSRTDNQLEEIYQEVLSGLSDSEIEIYIAREGSEHYLP